MPQDKRELGLAIVDKWKSYWFGQEDYRHRAMAIDANMRHHLAELIGSELARPRPEVERLLEQLEVAREALRFYKRVDAYRRKGKQMQMLGRAARTLLRLDQMRESE